MLEYSTKQNLHEKGGMNLIGQPHEKKYKNIQRVIHPVSPLEVNPGDDIRHTPHPPPRYDNGTPLQGTADFIVKDQRQTIDA